MRTAPIDINGMKKWLLTSKIPMKDEYGKITGLIGIGRDVTIRRQAEAELRESEIKLNVILQSTADGILAVDGNGKIIKTNKRFAELWRIPQELIDLGDDDALLSFVLDQLTNPDEFISKVQKLYHSTDEDLDHLYFRDGRTFERFSAPLIMPDSAIGRVWSFRDITERKLAENALRENEEKYRTVIENMGEGISFMNDKEVFVFVNPAAEKIFGVNKGGLADKCILDYLSVENAEKIKNETLKRRKWESSLYALEIILNDGSKKDILVTATPKFDDDKFIGTYGIFHDITNRKKAEEEIKLKNEELKKNNAEKDKFFSIIAHDLRGPFNGFLGLTQIMAEELPNLTMAKVQELAITMKNSATNLYRLLNNLLEWSQVQQGSMPFAPEVIQLRPMADHSLATAVEPAKNKGIDLSFSIPENIAVFADSNMLQTVIRNLVSNALKFTRPGGKVSLLAKANDDKSIEISIKDTGIGMSQTMVGNLFRMDVQTNRIGTEGEPSTGLGLLLCKEFIEKHGGNIWVESKEGVGSTFYFTLPCIDEPEEKAIVKNGVQAIEPGNMVKKLKILIAEDDETSRELISIQIRKFGNEIINVQTGRETVEACRNNPDIDLVLMDIQMPEMNGYEATRQIRQFNTGVIIIALTAFAMNGDREKAIEAGCNDYISKPINKEILVETIGKYFK